MQTVTHDCRLRPLTTAAALERSLLLISVRLNLFTAME